MLSEILLVCKLFAGKKSGAPSSLFACRRHVSEAQNPIQRSFGADFLHLGHNYDPS